MGAGDLVNGWTVKGPVSEIEVRVLGTVETIDLAGVFAWSPRDGAARGLYGGYHPDRGGCRAEGPVEGGLWHGWALAAAHRLSAAVADAIAYRPGATHAHTTAAEALALGEGVCQDHAHAMIACARFQGLPARYVSGYLFATADGTPARGGACLGRGVRCRFGMGWL